MRFMATQLAQGRAPSDIVQHYATQDAHRGRNDPCTCGSGRKWKHCHGADVYGAAAGGSVIDARSER
jgi:uncharacterized protein YecA (UPF0149 family)